MMNVRQSAFEANFRSAPGLARSETGVQRLKRALAALLMLAGVSLASQPVGAEDAFRIGVNRVNLAWLTKAEQQEILGQIVESGVTDVRLSLSRPVAKSIQALKIAHRLGLNILLEIQLSNKSYYPSDVRPRTSHGRLWKIYRLSDLDLDLYREELHEAISRIDETGIRLDAVEPGNEINIGPYNGDLHIYLKPGVRTARNLRELTNRAAFERGLDNYVAAVRITREELRATAHSRNAALVSSGLSDMGQEFADRQGFEHLNAADVIDMLRARGLDEVVDAYGIHIYTGDRPIQILAARISNLLDFCQPSDIGKPCWVTEWGVANDDPSCPVDDSKREAVIRKVHETFDALRTAGGLDALYYYDWDSHERYSIWRCGRLTPAGALAVGAEQP